MASTTFYQVSNRNIILLRVSIGIVYLWFGALKFFHGYSPAEDLVTNTIAKITYGLLSDHTNLMLLASWECAIGILLISGKWLKPAIISVFIHMACSFTPLLFFPSLSFKHVPYGFTLVGQYIMKNIIIVSAALILWQQQKEKSK